MSKYARLGDYLKQQNKERVPMTFGEIERITGVKLPRSARYRAWWSNNDFNSVLTKVWLAAGYRSEQVDMEAGKLVFTRIHETKERLSSFGKESGAPFHPAYGAMKGLIRIAPDTDLTHPADPAWGASLEKTE